MTIEEKAEKIITDIEKETGTDPSIIFKDMASKDYISMHGPEHHILDGACILAAYKNAGGDIDLKPALEKMLNEGLRMPGAMCGLWGVCGAVSSIGAALSIIDGTRPLTSDGSWGSHMMFTSRALKELGNINGPRCCKRDAMISFKNAVEYINTHYSVSLKCAINICEYSDKNPQCIKENCPFYGDKYEK